MNSTFLEVKGNIQWQACLCLNLKKTKAMLITKHDDGPKINLSIDYPDEEQVKGLF